MLQYLSIKLFIPAKEPYFLKLGVRGTMDFIIFSPLRPSKTMRMKRKLENFCGIPNADGELNGN